MHFSTALVGALAAALVVAHPGHDHAAEQLARREALKFSKKDLSHCAEKIKARGLEARSIKRRAALAAGLMKRNNLPKRDLTSLLSVSHHSSADYTIDTPVETVFATNNSCVLSPEVTEGPYYVAGEYIRSNVTEAQAGVALTLDIQILDVNTCEPIPDAYLEIWHANTTGVYSGVSAAGNGNGDISNLDATFLRGVQLSDADGTVQFHTLVPGHYSGRANHIHVMVHHNATAFENGTLIDTTQVGHTGQAFFDQSLLVEVEATGAYATNTQPITTNAEDGICAEEAATSDPFVQYVLLGDSVADGLLGWLSFGVNTTLVKSVTAAATHYEEGGVANPNAGMGGGPFPSGGGGPPSGFTYGGPPPSGSAAPVASSASAAPVVSTDSAAVLPVSTDSAIVLPVSTDSAVVLPVSTDSAVVLPVSSAPTAVPSGGPSCKH